jgi:hypothetical protein
VSRLILIYPTATIKESAMSSFNFTLEELQAALVNFPYFIQEEMLLNYGYRDIDSVMALGNFLSCNNLGGFKATCEKNVFKYQIYLNPVNVYEEILLYV